MGIGAMTPEPTLTGAELALEKKWLDECVEQHFDNGGSATTKNAVALFRALRRAHATIDELVDVIKSSWCVRSEDHTNCAYCEGVQRSEDASKRFPHTDDCCLFTLRVLQGGPPDPDYGR